MQSFTWNADLFVVATSSDEHSLGFLIAFGSLDDYVIVRPFQTSHLSKLDISAKSFSLSLKLFDAGQIDYVEVNGVKKDLTNNRWSDVASVTPG